MIPKEIAKAKRTRLTIAQKIEVGHLLQLGNPTSTVMRQFKVSERTVRNIKRSLPSLQQIVTNTTTTLGTKTLHPAYYPTLEAHLIGFLNFARAGKMPVTQSVLQTRALMIREKMLKAERESKEHAALERFTASRGWVENFVKRHALRSVALHGEAGQVQARAVAKDIGILRSHLSDYDAEHIYNIDETGLFYKLLPRRTYIGVSEDRKSLRGIKAMKAKDRITALVCTNATGTQKLPMAIIGTAKEPRCFKIRGPAVPYFQQKNAWADTITFRSWFYRVFLPFIRMTTSKTVALVMDNCGSHGDDLKDSRMQVRIFALPPNCTSLHQPMDMGVIASWKARYRHTLLRDMIITLETREERKKMAIANKLKPGMKGLNEGHDPHMLDVSEIVARTWEDVSERTIARCWIKSQILPMHHQADLVNLHGKVRRNERKIEKSMVDDIIRLLSRLSLESGESPAELSDLCRKDVEEWVEIETNEHVAEASISDACDSIEYDGERLKQTASEAMVDDSVAEDECDIERRAVPNAVVLARLFGSLESLGVECDVSIALSHLRSAKRAFLEARHEGQGRKQQQTLITEFWTGNCSSN